MARDNLAWKMVLDFVVLACTCAPLLGFLIWGRAHKVGFFEDDRSLSLPYKEETISEAWLAAGGFVFMLSTILIVEFVRDRKGRSVGEKFLCGSLVPGWVWESYITTGVFTFGAGSQQVTVEVTKYVLGKLRPHFFAVCQPIFDRNASANAFGYIQEYTCVNPDSYRVQQVRLSFPSAHSSFAMYCAVFFIIYIQIKGKWSGSKLLRHALQLVVFLMAWYVGLSRVVDHFHHWQDIAFGFFNGAVYACLIMPYVLRPRKYSPVWHEAGRQEAGLPRPVVAR